MNHERYTFFRFTKEILDKAELLKQRHGLSWHDIAERFGCDSRSLQVTLCKRRKGKNKGHNEIRKQSLEEMVNRLTRGETTRDIAQAMNMSSAAVSTRLSNHGFDKEVRAELRGKIVVPIVK